MKNYYTVLIINDIECFALCYEIRSSLACCPNAISPIKRSDIDFCDALNQ